MSVPADANELSFAMSTAFATDNENTVEGPLNPTFNLGMHSSTRSSIKPDIAVGTLIDITKDNMDESLGLLSFGQINDFRLVRNLDNTNALCGDDPKNTQVGNISEYITGESEKIPSVTPKELTLEDEHLPMPSPPSTQQETRPKPNSTFLSSPLNTTKDCQDLHLTEELFKNASIVIQELRSKRPGLTHSNLTPDGTQSTRDELHGFALLDDVSMLFDQSIQLCDLTLDDSDERVTDCADVAANIEKQKLQFHDFSISTAAVQDISATSLFTTKKGVSSTKISVAGNKRFADGNQVIRGSLTQNTSDILNSKANACNSLTYAKTSVLPASRVTDKSQPSVSKCGSVCMINTSIESKVLTKSPLSCTIDKPSCTGISVLTSSSTASTFSKNVNSKLGLQSKIKKPKLLQQKSSSIAKIGSRVDSNIFKSKTSLKYDRRRSIKRAVAVSLGKTGFLTNSKLTANHYVPEDVPEFDKPPSKNFGGLMPPPKKSSYAVKVKSNKVGINCSTVPARSTSSLLSQTRVSPGFRGTDLTATGSSTKFPDSLAVAPSGSKFKRGVCSTISGKIPVPGRGTQTPISTKIPGPSFLSQIRQRTAAVSGSSSKMTVVKQSAGNGNRSKPETTVKGRKPEVSRAGDSVVASARGTVPPSRPITNQNTATTISQIGPSRLVKKDFK